MLAYERGRPTDAHKLVDDVLLKEPKNATAMLLKARFAMAERRLDDALKLLNETIAAEPAAAAAHYYAGTVYAQTNRPDEATASFTEALKLNPRITAAQLQLAQINLARGRLGDSEALARQVLSSEPADPLSRLVLVDTLFAKGDLANAERELKPLETNFPKAAAVHVRRGRLAARDGNTDRARRSFSHAFELDPTSVDALSGLVATDIAANRMNDAKARVEKQLAAAPRNARLLLLAGSLYLAGRDFGKAEEVVLRAMEVDPSRLAAYDILGQIYMAQGRLDDARARFEHLERQERLATASGTVVAMILQAQNRTDEARRRYEAIVERDPKAAAAANNLAWLYAEAGGDLDRALQLANSARQVDPEEPQIADTIGWIYYKKQLPTLAIPEFETAIRLAPSNAVFHHHLGLAYLASGETAKGAASLRRALSIQSNFAGADEARQLLAQHKG
jgi:tetratricopeptide (TPR) repeat protein